MKSTHVVLLGDSTLDNVVWLHEDRDARVSQQLRRALGKDDETTVCVVTDFAADGFTSTDVLRGRAPAISQAMRASVGEPFPGLVDGIFSPLTALASLAEDGAATPPVTHVVVSVGGNDVREILSNLHELPATLRQYHRNIDAILTRVEAIVPTASIIVQLQYRPSLAMDRSYGVYAAIGMLPAEMLGLSSSVPTTALKKLEALMAQLYVPLIARARARGYILLDLPRTLDPRDERLFVSQIEPSALGGALIAALISHAVRTSSRTSASTGTRDIDTPPPLRARILSASWDRSMSARAVETLDIRDEMLGRDAWSVVDDRV